MLYYFGNLKEYASFRSVNLKETPKIPIYIGKADRKGKRKGLTFAPKQGTEISRRLGLHEKSINAAENLERADFACRYLAIEDAFIGLAESVLIAVFDPLWNRVLDGFGNNPTGGPRSGQAVSKWDLFHPGRRRGTGDERQSSKQVQSEVTAYFEANRGEIEEKLAMIRGRIEKYGLG